MTDQPKANAPLRVAVVTCSLGLAGAEKQSYYIAKALLCAGADVRVYTVMRGGEYQEALHRIGVDAKWIGWIPTPPLRASYLLSRLLTFRPHVIQSVHAYLNGYCALAGKTLGAVSIGGLRSDVQSFVRDHGRFAKTLLTWPDGLAVNSRNAIEEAQQMGLPDPKHLYFLPNAIDASTFPERPRPGPPEAAECNCLWVGRLFPAKRADLFLRALAEARSVEPGIRGTLIGYGPEYAHIEQLAEGLGLFPNGLEFLGFREDVGDLLQRADALVFTSESEGMPNVILEGLAASLPVITTPAGDAADLVQGANAGYVVPFGSVEAMAGAMVRLARSPFTRRRLGEAGRRYVERHYSVSTLGSRLLKIYAQVARTSKRGGGHPLLRSTQPELELEMQNSQ